MFKSIVRIILSTVMGLGGLIAVAGAEPLGTEFTYQGELRFQGAPANGTFDFRFSLYADADGLMFVDGPIEAQDVLVSDGVFTVGLDFGAAPFAGDALWLEVSVREGASTAGYAQLLPRQKITAAPYTLHAEMVAANAVSSVEIADASIMSADIAGNAVTSAKIAPGAVGGTDVDSTQVQLRVAGTCAEGESIRIINEDGTVTCEVDDGGLSSVTSADIEDETITAADIGVGAVGSSEADSTQVQLRVSGTCAAGESIQSVNADGTVTCEVDDDTTYDGTDFALSSQACAPGQKVLGVEANGAILCATDEGLTSVASSDIVDETIAAADIGPDAVGSSEVDSAQVQLRISGSCAVGQTIQSIAADGSVSCGFGQTFSNQPTFALTVDASGVETGLENSIAIAPDGLPVISYHSSSTLKVAKCNDRACSGGDETLTTVDNPANSVGRYTSIAIGADGLPVISYRDSSAAALKVAKCNDAACSGGNETITTVDDPAQTTGWDTTIAVGTDGFPIIAYYDSTAGALRVAKCNDAACSGGNETITVINSGNDMGREPSIAIGSDGLPVISYQDATAETLEILKCNDAACSGNDETVTTVDNDAGRRSSIAIAPDGFPVASYYGIAENDIKVVKCNDHACSGGDETISVLPDAASFLASDITIGPHGFPIVVYYTSGAQAVNVAKCNDAACSGGDETINTVVDTFDNLVNQRIVIGIDGLPVISYFADGPDDLKVVKCGNLECS